MNFNIKKFNHSLAVQLLKVVFSIYLFITVFMTLMQMFYEYQSEKKAIEYAMLKAQTIFEDSLENSLWRFNDEQAEAILRGMKEMPGIEGVKIINQDRETSTYQQIGIILNNEGKIISAEKEDYVAPKYLALFEHSFSIYFEKQKIGEVTLYSSNKQVFDKVKNNFYFIIINAIIKTIALWTLFIWAFNKYLTKQIDNFCYAMEEVDMDSHDTSFLKLDNFDTLEFSRIEHFFNAMLKRLKDTRAKWNELNKTLEEKVAQRTEELEKSNLEQQKYIKIIEKIAVTDEMTQLYNRRHFNEVFPKEIQRAMRDKYALSFLIFDVDHFKQYNDNYGHQKGDDALIAIGKLLNEKCNRAGDIPFRLGGEEFGIVFSHKLDESGLSFAEKIRQSIEKLEIEHQFNSASNHVTASFGLVTLFADVNNEFDMDDLYKLADKALYKAKENGRNQVVQESMQ